MHVMDVWDTGQRPLISKINQLITVSVKIQGLKEHDVFKELEKFQSGCRKGDGKIKRKG